MGAFGSFVNGPTISGIPYSISYVGGDGFDVVISIDNPTQIWVNDTWLETSNTSGGAPGVVEIGDIVHSNTGLSDASGPARSSVITRSPQFKMRSMRLPSREHDLLAGRFVQRNLRRQ